MDEFAQQLSLTIPRLSTVGRTILAEIAYAGGCIDCPDSVAAKVQLRSRHQLARLLRREGLPQIEELCAWVKVLLLLHGWEHTHQSLYAMAVGASFNPPTCYRLIKRVTGKTWRQACADGFGMMLIQFANRCSAVSKLRSHVGGQVRRFA